MKNKSIRERKRLAGGRGGERGREREKERERWGGGSPLKRDIFKYKNVRDFCGCFFFNFVNIKHYFITKFNFDMRIRKVACFHD